MQPKEVSAKEQQAAAQSAEPQPTPQDMTPEVPDIEMLAWPRRLAAVPKDVLDLI